MALLCTMIRSAINWENDESVLRVKRGRGERCRGKLDFLSLKDQKEIYNTENNKQANKKTNKWHAIDVASYRCVSKRIRHFHWTREVYLKDITDLRIIMLFFCNSLKPSLRSNGPHHDQKQTEENLDSHLRFDLNLQKRYVF